MALAARQAAYLMPRALADGFEHLPALANDDGLLPLVLHDDVLVYLDRSIGAAFIFFIFDRERVGQFFLQLQKTLFTCQFARQ